MNVHRRQLLQTTAVIAAASGLAAPLRAQDKKPWFEISLAQWSLHRQFFGRPGFAKLDPLDFAVIAKRDFGINAIEYVNQFYKDVVKQPDYLAELKKRAADQGVAGILIMCDGEGNLGDPDIKRRVTAVRNHIKWLEWAKELGCHSIRVNAASDGKLSFQEQQQLAADGLRRLCEIGDTYDLNVIVENHGGLSSHGGWLRGVMELVNHPRVGTLPDFGNFRVRGGAVGLEYDRYLGVHELMPFAKGVSAKSHDFDSEGNEIHTDYKKMLKIVHESGFRGHVGIEYEGNVDSYQGIRATKALLEKVRDQAS
ncbi:MAG: sugar phosphate isomerase/epimerase [Pirellulaceae bacterium]|nr:sugar phosphate isomerase/epimerase [Pirellulaceae bacterium]